jgi:molybdopterin-binding protein
MKLSARNQLKGKITDVKKGATTAHVRIDVGGQIITASITNESADELKLEKGKTAYAIIKATSVMVGVDGSRLCNVRVWHKADISRLSSNVRFWG